MCANRLGLYRCAWSPVLPFDLVVAKLICMLCYCSPAVLWNNNVPCLSCHFTTHSHLLKWEYREKICICGEKLLDDIMQCCKVAGTEHKIYCVSQIVSLFTHCHSFPPGNWTSVRSQVTIIPFPATLVEQFEQSEDDLATSSHSQEAFPKRKPSLVLD